VIAIRQKGNSRQPDPSERLHTKFDRVTVIKSVRRRKQITKKLVLRFAVLTLAASAFGAVQRTASGIGVGYAPDQATADQQADAASLSAFLARSNCSFRGDANYPNDDWFT
jgi:hypothetical protein